MFDCAWTLSCEQTQVGGRKTSVVLPKLDPDTPYTVGVAAIYPTGVSREVTAAGRTSESPRV